MTTTPIQPEQVGGGRAFMGSQHLQGFTMVELVLTLLLVVILAVVVVPRLFSVGTFQQRGFTDTVAAALRYARLQAWATECPVEAKITPSGYQLLQQSGCTGGAFKQSVANPASNAPFRGQVPKGVSISSGAGTIVFGVTGVPTATHTLTITGPGGTATLTVYADTGYVQSQG